MSIKRLDKDPRTEKEKLADEEIIRHIGCCDKHAKCRRKSINTSNLKNSYYYREGEKIALSLIALRKNQSG